MITRLLVARRPKEQPGLGYEQGAVGQTAGGVDDDRVGIGISYRRVKLISAFSRASCGIIGTNTGNWLVLATVIRMVSLLLVALPSVTLKVTRCSPA